MFQEIRFRFSQIGQVNFISWIIINKLKKKKLITVGGFEWCKLVRFIMDLIVNLNYYDINDLITIFFLSLPSGFTGILLVMVCTVIYTFAFQYARRRVFNLFWFTHNMWIIYFILMFLHGSGRLVQPPFTHYFALGPIILFTLDKLVSISRKKAEIAVTRAELLPSGTSKGEGVQGGLCVSLFIR